MQREANRIAGSHRRLPVSKGMCLRGRTGARLTFWTCSETTPSAAPIHDFDEYMMVVQDCYTWILYMPKQDEKRIPIKAECFIPRGTLHGGEVVAGTRTIKAFGGHRATGSSRVRTGRFEPIMLKPIALDRINFDPVEWTVKLMAAARSPRSPRWFGIVLRVCAVTLIGTLLCFAVSLLLAILGIVIISALRGVHPDMRIAYRAIALPIALVAGGILFVLALVMEIRHYRQTKTLSAIERLG
jgi:hypothetical protein